MKRPYLAVALAASLAACSGSGVQTAQTDVAAAVGAIQAACMDALAAGQIAGQVAKGGAASTVAAVNVYVQAGCGTAEAISKLAANSSSLAWLGQQTGTLKTIANPPAVVALP